MKNPNPLPYFNHKSSDYRPLYRLLCLSLALICVNAQSAASTTYDGVTEDGYVSYMSLNGTNGAKIQIPNSPALHVDMPYTLMIWFKPSSDDWKQRYQYAFRIQDAIECYFTESATIICQSFEKCDKLMTSVASVANNYWTHLTVSGDPSIGSYLSLETNTNSSVAYDNKTYVIMRQIYWHWYGCIGNCDSLYGFKGGLRDFVYLSQYLPRATTSRIKNYLLSYDSNMMAYYRFNEASFNKDLYRDQYAVADKSLLAIDYIPNDICSPFQDYIFVLNVNEDFSTLPVIFDGRWNPDFQLYGYSFAMQLQINSTSCYTTNPYDARSTCNIFFLQEVFMLYLDSKNSFKIYFFAVKNFYEAQSRSIFIPQNQWVNIQVSMSRYGGYQVRVYDIRGKMISWLSENRDMFEQRPNKQLTLFQNFRGQVKSFILFQTARPLPIDFNVTGIEQSWDVLGYWRFDQEYASGNNILGQTLNPIALNFQKEPQFQAEPYKHFAYGSGQTQGLVTYSESLFDGISCKDDNYASYLKGNHSYYQARTAPRLNLTAMTVEFWFKALDPVQSGQYLFSMKEDQTNSTEIFQIYTNSDLTLICAPYGNHSVRSPIIRYTSYTETSRQASQWFHVGCQLQVSQSARGFIFSDFIGNQQYQSDWDLSTIENQFLNNVTYNIIVGNNHQKNKGTRMMVKELRIWPELRTFTQIQEWRNRQINQQNYLPKTLLTYLRFTEGGHREFNFANNYNSSVPRDVQQNRTSYLSDANLLICPAQTYPINGRCYLNPVSQAIATFIPVHNETTQSITWMISANYSSMMNQSFFNSLDVKFSSDHPLIQSTINNSSRKFDFNLSTDVLINENTYKLALTFQNQAITFQNRQEVLFVPNSCKYFKMDQSNAHQSYLSYNETQGLQNISLKMVPVLVKQYCNLDSFYNSLEQRVTYSVTPFVSDMPKLEFRYNQDLSIDVNIPSYEQLKFPKKQEVKIIFQIYYTNNKYYSLLDTKQFRFQDVIQTIKFNVEPVELQIVATQNATKLLKYDTLRLDGSQTRVVGNNTISGEAGNITYSWICPNNTENICRSAQNGPILDIYYYMFSLNAMSFNQTYTFIFQATWHKPDNTKQTLQKSFQAIWYDVKSPAFTLYKPTKVKSTAENVFSIQFDNYDETNSQNLTISWIVSPELSLPGQNLTSRNNTVFTVAKGLFLPEVTYTLTVSVQDKNYDIAYKEKNINFTTSSPPFGGQAQITPQRGNLSETQFTVFIRNWQSNNRPIKYRSWYGDSPNSNSPRTLIDPTNWYLETQNQTFVATQVNSIIVEVSDASEESVFISLFPNITAPPSANITNMISRAVEPNQSVYQKHSFLLIASMRIHEEEEQVINPTQEYISKQIDLKSQVMTELEKELVTLNDPSVSSKDVAYLISQSVYTLNFLLEHETYLNDDLVTKALYISNQLFQSEEIIEDLLSDNSDFARKYADLISHLMKYGDVKSQALTNSRRLVETFSMQGARQMFNEVGELKEKFISFLCRVQNSLDYTRNLNTQNFDIILQKFRTNQDIDNRAFTQDQNGENLGMGSEYITRVNFFINQLVKDALTHQVITQDQEFCIATTFLKVNPKPLSSDEKKYLTQYSQSIVEFQVLDQTGELTLFNQDELRNYTEIIFSVNKDTFKNNQTVCMSYGQIWDEEKCNTQIITDKFQIICDCNMINSQYYTVMTDETRVQLDDLTFPEEIICDLPTYSESSFAFLGIVVVLAAFGLFFSILSVNLDKRDFKKCQEPIKSQYKLDLLKQVSKLSDEPLGFWYYKQMEVFKYALRQDEFISILFSSIYPIISFIVHFDFKTPRISRFSLYFFQLALYGFICSFWFGTWYRSGDLNRNSDSIDQFDINQMLFLSIIGAIMLLPLPVCFKSSFTSTLDNTQQQNCSQNQVSFVKIDNQTLQNSQNQVVVIPKTKRVGKIVTLFLLALACIKIVVSGVYGSKTVIVNQQCMVAAFYFGWMLSLFITNPLRVCLNAFLTGRALKSNSCLKAFVASKSLEIYQNINLVQLADQKLMERLDRKLEKEPLNSDSIPHELAHSNKNKLSNISENSCDEIGGSLTRGLPDLVDKYSKTECNTNKLHQDDDDSFPSEKLKKNPFNSYVKSSPDKQLQIDASPKVLYSQVKDKAGSMR